MKKMTALLICAASSAIAQGNVDTVKEANKWVLNASVVSHSNKDYNHNIDGFYFSPDLGATYNIQGDVYAVMNVQMLAANKFAYRLGVEEMTKIDWATLYAEVDFGAKPDQTKKNQSMSGIDYDLGIMADIPENWAEGVAFGVQVNDLFMNKSSYALKSNYNISGDLSAGVDILLNHNVEFSGVKLSLFYNL